MLPLRKNLTSVIFILILAIFVLVSLFYLGRTVKESASLSSSRNKKLKLINYFCQKKPFPPSETLLEYYRNKKEKNSEYYKSFHTLFVSDWNKMPRSVLEPLKFKEKLFKLQSKITKKARARKLTIGDGALYFGFDKYESEIPQASDIPDLMVELQAVEELTSLMMQSHITSLERVRILEPQDKTLPLEELGRSIPVDKILSSEKQPFVRIFPIQISFEANSKDFIKFLSLCAKNDFIFVLSDMHIYRFESEKKTLRADILLNLVIFLEK